MQALLNTQICSLEVFQIACSTFIVLVEVSSVDVICLCRLVIYTDNDFQLNSGFK